MLRSIVKKFRGALGTAITWSVTWALGGLGLAAGMFVLSPRLNLGMFFDAAPMVAMLAGATGFVGGTVFSAVLGTVHARKRLADLSATRMALWGGVAGLLVPLGVLGGAVAVGALPLTTEIVLATVSTFGGLGIATGAATIKLAQSGGGELGGAYESDLLGPGE